MTFAIIKTGGKQYKIQEGDVLTIEKLPREKRLSFAEALEGRQDTSVAFEDILLVVDDKGIKVGKPTVAGAKVEAKILEEGKGKKKMVFRYHSKTRYRKKKGHRQPYTKVQITKISS